jgi:hypothetical protein
LERALSICQQQLGREHPQTKRAISNYLWLLAEIHTGGDLDALLQLLAQEGLGKYWDEGPLRKNPPNRM